MLRAEMKASNWGEFFELTAEDKKDKLKYEKALQSDKLHTALLVEIRELPPDKLFRLCHNSAAFREFCNHHSNILAEEYAEQKPYRGQAYLFKHWVEDIRKGGVKSPGFAINAADGEHPCTTLHQYLGKYLYEALNQNWEQYLYQHAENADSMLAKALLAKACEFGLLNALVKRCEINIKILRDRLTSLTPIEIETIKDEVKKDTSKLVQYYGSIGCEYATLYLMNLGLELKLNYLISLEQNKQQQDPDDFEAAESEGYLFQCVDAIHQAERLDQDEHSNQLKQFFFEGENIHLAIFHAKDWKEVKKNVLHFTGYTEEKYKNLLKHS
jgi:hypothetical protein